MIETLFPAGVVALAATESMWDSPLHPEEATAIERAVERRRREFAAGRACARAALERLGIRDAVLAADADRIPRWPRDIVGCISHTREWCGVAVARRGPILALGLDVETVVALRPEIASLVCTPRERERFEADGSRPESLLFVFSAKECAYKCLFPLVRTFLDFHDVEVALEHETGEFVARVLRGLPPADRRVEIRGRFRRDARRVYTGAVIAADDGVLACGTG